MAATKVELSPIIKVSGVALSADVRSALVSVDVDRALNLVGRATLRFVETGFKLVAEAKFALGETVKIAAPNGTEIFAGEVTGVSLDQEQHHGPAVTELTVTVDDAAYKLGRATKNEAFLNRGYDDIVKTMASDAGLTPDVDATGGPHPYLLQTGTNLAYLDWVAGRCGMVWWVDAGKLHVKKAGTSSGTVPLELGTSLLRVSTRASGLHSGKVTVTGWDDAQQAAVQHAAAETQSAEADLVSDYPGRSSSSGAGITIAGASPLTTAEAQQLSEAALAEATAAAVTTRGTTLVNAAVKPGVSVTITDAGRASGTYLVSQVRHTYDTTGFYSHFTAGPIRPDGLVDLLGAPPVPSGGVISGLIVGVVSNIDDPDKLGRLKAQLPTLGTNIESEWARVVTIGGGADRGVVFQPELNDEVLVGFEQGDTRRPVVIGGLFSKKNELPTSDNIGDGKVNYRRISSRLGHVIELADGSGDDKQHILLKTKKGAQVRVGEDKLEIEIANKPVTISNGKAKIEFSDSGDVTISGVNVTIKAQSAFKVEGGSGVELKSNAVAKLQGVSVEVKGSASGTVDGGGPLALKGATVAIN